MELRDIFEKLDGIHAELLHPLLGNADLTEELWVIYEKIFKLRCDVHDAAVEASCDSHTADTTKKSATA